MNSPDATPPDATPPGATPPDANPSGLPQSDEAVLCSKHGVHLEAGKVELTYQGHTFPVDMLRCPVCGQAYIPEELARGSMLEVEQTLEDK